MPMRAPRICGCGMRVASGAQCICQRKRMAEADKRRPTARQRGYDAAWQKVRKDFLARNPRCSHPACSAPATEPDHILSVRERPDLRLSWSNLRPFCKRHHSQRTARDQAFGRDGSKGGGFEVLSESQRTGGVPQRETQKNSILGIGGAK